jgi:hypothetical protein
MTALEEAAAWLHDEVEAGRLAEQIDQGDLVAIAAIIIAPPKRKTADAITSPAVQEVGRVSGRTS